MRCHDANLRWLGARRGQALIEYAVMVGAITLGVLAAANLAYKAFVGHAQTIERDGIVF